MKATNKLAAITAGITLAVTGVASAGHAPYEVWAVDQTFNSNSGQLHVYSGKDNQFRGKAGGPTLVHQVDMGVDSAAGGWDVGAKPHMTLFAGNGSHMVIGHASNGVITLIDATTKQIVDSYDIRTDIGGDLSGGKTHAVIPAPDNSFVLVANTGSSTAMARVELDLSGSCAGVGGKHKYFDCSGGVATSPTTIAIAGKSICPVITDDSAYAYVTIATGGLVILDTATGASLYTYTADSAMTAAAGATTRGEIGAKGCGGIQNGDVMYINSGNPDPEDTDAVYAFDNSALPGSRPSFVRIPQGGNDSHGMLIAGNYMWACNRGSNTCNVHDTATNVIVNTIDVSGGVLGDTAPDLIDISPSGKVVFIAQRGPNPQSANDPAFNNAVGDNPGVGVLQVTANGKDGKPANHLPINNGVGAADLADIHAIRVRQ